MWILQNKAKAGNSESKESQKWRHEVSQFNHLAIWIWTAIYKDKRRKDNIRGNDILILQVESMVQHTFPPSAHNRKIGPKMQ